MKQSSDVTKYIDASDSYLLNKILAQLTLLKSKGLICGLFVGNDLITRTDINVLKIKITEIHFSDYYLQWIASKLTDLGYNCSSVKDSSGASGSLFILPTALYFHVNYKLTFWQTIQYFICKYIFRMKIF